MFEKVSADPVKISVRLRDGDGGQAEHLWAEPVDAGDSGGRYRVLNNAFLCPLLLDDVVRAELDADELLQVTGIVSSGGRESLVVYANPADAEAFCRVADEWRETGTHTEGAAGSAFVVARAPSPAARPNDGELDTLVASGVITGWERWRPPELDSHLAQMGGADLRLRTTPDPERHPSHSTTYWAGDDPYWREHRFDDPEFLGYVQWLAHNDVQVARALERGKHNQVLRYIEILSMDPHDWLDGEVIFDPEDTAGEL
jgi:hypothetical protein